MKLKLMLVSMLVAASVLIVGCSQQDDSVNVNSSQKELSVAPTQKYVPGQLIVKFKDGQTLKSKTDVMQAFGGSVIQKIYGSKLKGTDNGSVYLYNIKTSVESAISKLTQMPNVEYAEPNYIYTTQVTSNDPYFTNRSLWGMYGDASTPANQYGCQAAEAWALNHTGSSTVYVGVIDEGYMYNHADLAANAGTNPGEIPNNGIDDDNNGYIDDVYGWNFDGNNNSVFDSAGDTHGTHVAGTIGGVGGNGIGVAGVCWNVKIISGKFLGTNGGTSANAILAIDYFVDLKTRHNLNLVALNNSWGGGGFSQALKDAIDRASAAGILFIAAAGNGGSDGIGDNNDRYPSYPSNYTSSNIIAVASITSSGARSSFSNYGATSVDIGAPGSSIYSCLPGSGGGSTYGTMSGTSMATPHVTGATALYASTHPGATMTQIKTAILNSAVATTSLRGKCVTGGRLNVSGF
jgi:subtilisin family serine protease